MSLKCLIPFVSKLTKTFDPKILPLVSTNIKLSLIGGKLGLPVFEVGVFVFVDYVNFWSFYVDKFIITF